MSNDTSCGTTAQYELPTKDFSCAIPNTSDKYSDLMKKCCGDAPVTPFDNDCASYCLAVDQSVEELTACLHDKGNGVEWQEVWCVGKGNDTATGKPTSTKDEVSETGGASASGTESSASETSTGAASVLRVAQGSEGWGGASSVVVLGLAAFWGLGAVVVGGAV